MAEQLIDSATSTAMNDRACGRGRSTREFIAKLGVVLEEADQSDGWLEFIERAERARGTELQGLKPEAKELVAIFAASHRTAKTNHQRLRMERSSHRDR